MSDDWFIAAVAVLVLIAPGLTGHVLVAWRNRRTPDAWPTWAGWLAGTSASVALCGVSWAYAVVLQREAGTDDGSAPMALTVLIACVASNALVGVVLLGAKRVAAKRRARISDVQ